MRARAWLCLACGFPVSTRHNSVRRGMFFWHRVVSLGACVSHACCANVCSSLTRMHAVQMSVHRSLARMLCSLACRYKGFAFDEKEHDVASSTVVLGSGWHQCLVVKSFVVKSFVVTSLSSAHSLPLSNRIVQVKSSIK